MKNRSSLTIFTTILSVIGSFALLPEVKGAPEVTPPPDGCYPGFTTAEGCLALQSLTTGEGNTGVGWRSLFSVGAGSFNTGVGAGTLVLNTGDSNTAVGTAALLLNTSGTENTAVGTDALVDNDVGARNTAVGFQAMQNAAGSSNVFNTAVGIQALMNTTANANTAVGDFALQNVSGGAGNTAIGAVAGENQTTGDGNIYIGNGVGGVAGESQHTYIKNIDTTTVSGGGTDFVTVNLSTGLIGHVSSSRRYKEDIKAMEKTSETLYRLHPVTFRYKKEIDQTQSPAFGLIAEEVAEVNPDLVARNPQGEIESVHYEWVNAMLLNEFLKEHKKVQEQQASVAELRSTVAQQKKDFQATVAQLTARLDEQAAQIQKVSAQLEVSKSAPRVVTNKP